MFQEAVLFQEVSVEFQQYLKSPLSAQHIVFAATEPAQNTYPYKGIEPQRQKDLSCIELDEVKEYHGSLASLTLDLLKKNPGVFIGDSKGSQALYELLIADMEKFQKAGVGVLFIQLPKLSDQILVDQCDKNENALMLREQLLNAGWDLRVDGLAKTYVDLILAASKAGIRVVGIEKDSQFGSTLEMTNANFLSKINNHCGNENYLVIADNYHSSHYSVYRGLDYLLGIPSIDSMTGTSNKIVKSQYGSSDFRLSLETSPNQAADIFDSFLKN